MSARKHPRAFFGWGAVGSWWSPTTKRTAKRRVKRRERRLLDPVPSPIEAAEHFYPSCCDEGPCEWCWAQMDQADGPPIPLRLAPSPRVPVLLRMPVLA